MNPLISIITPSYNKRKYIKETIDSVVSQTYVNWELIIIDDGSTDGTLDIILDSKKTDERIKLLINDENRGANYSRNIGIKEAKGIYIVFLDADDLLMPDCLEERHKVISSGNFDFCVFSMGVFTYSVGDSGYKWIPDSKKPLEDFLQHKLPWSILQPIWRKEFLIQINGFDESFQRLQDVDMHTRALMEPGVAFLADVKNLDCYYRIDEERKNFDAYSFLKRRVFSSNMYCSKFYTTLKDTFLKKHLYVTIYKTYLQLVHQYKLKTISTTQFSELEGMLFAVQSPKLTFFHKSLFSIGYFFSSLPLRVPGINWLIYKLIKL
ncbi:MAG: glycosyltransferase family A protein [Bacteroidota bacterium]